MLFSEKVEAAAQAAFHVCYFPAPVSWENQPPQTQAYWLKMAEAALRAVGLT